MPIIELLPGSIGEFRRDGGRSRIVTERTAAGVAVYGPYERRERGAYRVRFAIKVVDSVPPLGDPVCFRVDVFANRGQTRLAEKFVLFSQINVAKHITLDFDLFEPREVEYRVITEGQVALEITTQVDIERLGDVRRIAHPLSLEQREWRNEREFLDGYLRNVTGLIHVGANVGQERRYYWLIGLDVLWVEPIREIYEICVDHLSSYPRQCVYNELLGQRSGEKLEFKIANNNGASSSILELQDHTVLFPDVAYSERRFLTSKTLPDLLAECSVHIDQYQALTLDVEGAEKLVLEGARSIVSQFKYVKCEVADFPVRAGTPTVGDLAVILEGEGFQELARRAFATGPNRRGTYWDIVWKKVEPGRSLNEPGTLLPLVFNPYEVSEIEKCE